MIVSFRCKRTEALFRRESVHAPWRDIARIMLRKLSYIHAAAQVRDLEVPPGNRLEKLKGDRAAQYSIRINQRWRICFEWHDGEARNVEIVDYH